jgi:hypothetical protein
MSYFIFIHPITSPSPTTYWEGTMLRPGSILLVILVSCQSIVSSSNAQTPTHTYTSLIPYQTSGYAVEVKGFLEATIGEQTYSNEYTIQYPEKPDQWNGRLMVGMMGRPAEYLRFNWGYMQDMIGQYALDEGYAVAMVDVININNQPDRDEVNRRFLDFAKAQTATAWPTSPKTDALSHTRACS